MFGNDWHNCLTNKHLIFGKLAVGMTMSHLCIFLLVDINGIRHTSRGRFIDNWLIMMPLDDSGVGFYHLTLKCKK